MDWQRKLIFLLLFVPIILVGILFSYFEIQKTTPHTENKQVQQEAQYAPVELQPEEESAVEEQEYLEEVAEEEFVEQPRYNEGFPKKEPAVEEEGAIRFEYDMSKYRQNQQ